MHIAAGQGRDNHRGQNFDVSRNLLSLLSFPILSNLILPNFFHDFMNVYSPGPGADNPLGTKFWFQHEHVVTSVICCKFKKKSLWSLILYIFFSWFCTCIAPGRGRKPPGDKVLMSTEMSCHFIHLLQVSTKCLWSLILYIFSCFNTCI